MDSVSSLFDRWAKTGKDELMEKEHGKNVIKILKTLSFDKSFSFLDVGCGNGWVVRKIANEQNCKKAVGIDKSKNMVRQANSKKKNITEKYIHTDIESLKCQDKFDFIFAMESIYYVNSIEIALKKIYNLLKPRGQFLCGTDFYTDNKTTTRWKNKMNVQMHLHSKQEWKKFFNDAGFETKTKHIKDLTNKKKWKREFGTLLIIGKKPERQSSN